MVNVANKDWSQGEDAGEVHPRSLKSLSTGLTILDLFTEESPELGITEIARHLKLSKAGVHRLLVTLLGHGYVRREPDTGRYRLGLKAWEVGRRALAPGLWTLAHQKLVRLAKETGETASVAVLDGSEMLFLDSVESLQAVSVKPSPGRAPVYATAGGKAVLAVHPDPDRIIAEAAARRPSDWPPLDRATLDRELDTVRKTGYGLNLREFRQEVVAAAAAVLDSRGEAVGALIISGPASRLDDEAKVQALGGIVRGIAEELSRELGYLGNPVFSGAGR